jgi:DNA-binding beta-propeller fold protein YncE
MSYLAPAKRSLQVVCLLVVAFLLLAVASQARAADSVYWANYGSGKISFANLAGGGGGDLDISGADGTEANGLAIDAAAGRAYWISTAGKIFYANLSGGGGGELSTAGATAGFSLGLAIDPAAGRIYWATNANKISYANLNGSGGGDLDTTGATVEGPTGVAVDPATGRIYWGNAGGADRISYASLSGGNGGNLNTTGATGEEADGVAIDSASGRIYWANYQDNKISYAGLNGSGGGDLNTTGATVDRPFGVAVDPTAGRIYWADEIGNKISFADLNGSGGGDLDTTGATLARPAFPALLKAPTAGAAPQASGRSKPGSILSCAPASWAPDLLESFLYRAPQTTSMQWLRNGQPVGGVTIAPFAASAVGSYSCQNTATNQAGSTSQTSTPVAIFSLGRKAKPDRKKGTAILAVRVPGPGTVTLAGKRLVRQKGTRKADSTGTVRLFVRARGKAKKALGKKGKVKVKATVTFAPLAGTAASQTKNLVLKKKLNG